MGLIFLLFGTFCCLFHFFFFWLSFWISAAWTIFRIIIFLLQLKYFSFGLGFVLDYCGLFFLAINAKSFVIFVAHFAKVTALIDVIVSWIFLRFLLPQWKRDTTIILKLSYNKSGATINVVLSSIILYFIMAIWRHCIRCFTLAKIAVVYFLCPSSFTTQK